MRHMIHEQLNPDALLNNMLLGTPFQVPVNVFGDKVMVDIVVHSIERLSRKLSHPSEHGVLTINGKNLSGKMFVITMFPDASPGGVWGWIEDLEVDATPINPELQSLVTPEQITKGGFTPPTKVTRISERKVRKMRRKRKMQVKHVSKAGIKRELRQCSVPECHKTHRAKGLCSSHYNKAHYLKMDTNHINAEMLKELSK